MKRCLSSAEHQHIWRLKFLKTKVTKDFSQIYGLPALCCTPCFTELFLLRHRIFLICTSKFKGANLSILLAKTMVARRRLFS